MRTNKFGEKYCHATAEARSVIDNSENGWEVYCTNFSEAEGETKATAEILENESGDIVCYLESDTVTHVKAIAIELDIEIQG